MKKINYLILILAITGGIFYFKRGVTFVPAEELTIPSGFGLDVIEDKGPNKTYSVPIAIYNFNTRPQITSIITYGEGQTIGSTRESRQLKIDKKLLPGLEKVVVAGESAARYGITPWFDSMFANPNINDLGYITICKGSSANLMEHKIEGYPNSLDYIEGIIKNSIEENFFPNKYRLIDAYQYLVGEGKNLTLPYIEIKGKYPEITGLAIFNKDKMVKKINVKEAKAMNLLRESNVRGIISLEKNSKKYTDVYVTSKKKVKAYKNEGKYIFDINLNVKGYIISNLIYENPYSEPKSLSYIEKAVQEEIKKMTEEFIEKMQNEYKIDCLNLGKYGAGKFGRNSGVDWNSIVSNAKINVNVKTKISIQTRGQIK